MVPPALPRIEAQEDLAAGEQLRPLAQRMQAVERHPGAERKGPAVLLARREVGGEEEPLPREIRKEAADVLQLRDRDALEAEPRVREAGENAGAAVRLHGIEDAIHRREPADGRGGAVQALRVVDVERALLGGQGQQVLPPPAPPLSRGADLLRSLGRTRVRSEERG